MAPSNSDARKTLKELVDEIKRVFKKHSRTARERAWDALSSKGAQKDIKQMIKNPSITVNGTSRWLSFREWVDLHEENKSIMKVYRGTGPAGLKEMRPSEEGVYGPGIYFYDNEKDARVYAEPGGGVVVAEVDSNDPDIKIISNPVRMAGSNIVLRYSKIIVVPDASKVRVVGTLH